MSTAAAVETAVPVKSGKKKLVLIVVVVLVLVLAAAGAAAVLLMKHKAQAEEQADAEADEAAPTHETATKRDPNVAPVFVPLDTFTVNLADREADRYAQVGMSLELEDSKGADRVKAFMPAIRNNILMVLSHKRSSDLLERAGKEQLAAEVLRETERALGIEPAAPGKRGPAGAEHRNPVRSVVFSTFIIQ